MNAILPESTRAPVGTLRAAAAALLLLLLGAALHVWYLLADCPLDLSGDEAHYWEWSRRLDWSYYSKGPLIAWLIAAGRWLLGDWSVALVGNEMLAVRLPAVALSVTTGMGLFVLALQASRRPSVALAAVAISATLPILAVGAILMTIDAPLACCWTWALVAGLHALRRDSTWAWCVVGMLSAVGVLAKLNMLMLAAPLAGALLMTPAWRHHLRRPGPYLAATLAAAGLLPIVAWNAQHDWVSFRHVAGQAGAGHDRQFLPLGPLEYAIGQAAVLSPIWFGLLLVSVGACARQTPATRHASHCPDALRFLALAAATPFAVFLGFSFVTKIQPNWPVAGVLPALVLLAVWLAGRLAAAQHARSTRRWIITAAAVGVSMSVVAHRSDLLIPALAWLNRDAPPWDLTPAARFDPAARLRGWQQLGAAVGEVLEQERAAGRAPFILTDDYQTSSQIAFYCPGNPVTYCAQAALGDRLSQYDIWVNPLREREQFVGRPVIYVGSLRPEITGEAGISAALQGLRRVLQVEHVVRGHRLRIWVIHAADAFAGFTPQTVERRY